MEVKMEMHFELPENFAEAHGFGENSRFNTANPIDIA